MAKKPNKRKQSAPREAWQNYTHERFKLGELKRFVFPLMVGFGWHYLRQDIPEVACYAAAFVVYILESYLGFLNTIYKTERRRNLLTSLLGTILFLAEMAGIAGAGWWLWLHSNGYFMMLKPGVN
jgi:hypothetical protein